MSKKNLLAKGLVTLSLFTQHFAWAQTTKTVERPPQFVAFAFDGSYNNEIWQYSRDFTKHKKSEGVDTHFTFFINPVYLLTPATKSIYKAPGGNRGSAIGWGDDNPDVSERVNQMNDAYREGHEIGSHAVGHFDGSRWTEEDWKSEFSQFDYIVKNMFSINGLRTTSRQYNSLIFLKDIVGFRAPQLGVSKGLYPTLASYGFKYDTSKTAMENYWPTRNSYGTWNFPLAEVKEPGGARRWISMDYNFCVRDSARILAEQPDAMSVTAYDSKKGKTIKNNDKFCLKAISAEQKAKVKANMLNIYRSYFNTNYYGNRAPIHIGHHFSSWMSGAYLEVFYEFANEVCSKPEVKCGTYADLLKFVEGKSSSEIAALQAGNFAKLPRPKAATMARHWDLDIKMVSADDSMKFQLVGKDAQRAGLKKMISIDGVTTELKGDLSLDAVRAIAQKGEDALVRIAVKDRLDKEVATATYQIEKVGTSEEVIGKDNIEEKWLEGHLAGAHAEDEMDTRGH
ncbi:hypothetical protein [Bdellovibrio sp. HCB-162]|uniref:hypothetical protein n=1 Tax=Bdellovibrio sp. HCB-162 TaxID=3394234 RepID=UPI0039BC44D1